MRGQGEGEREREERDRQTDRQTDRQRAVERVAKMERNVGGTTPYENASQLGKNKT